MVAAHAVYAASWGCGRGADEDAGVGRGVGIEARDRSCEHLRHVGSSSSDRAAYVVRIVFFQVVCRRCVTFEYTVAKSGREAFDLVFDGFGSIFGRARGNVTISVARVFSRGCARRVELALLA